MLNIPNKTMIRTRTSWLYNPATKEHDIAIGTASTINPDNEHLFMECEGIDQDDARAKLERMIDEIII